MAWATREELEELKGDPLWEKFRAHLQERLQNHLKAFRTAGRAGTLEQVRSCEARISTVDEILMEMEEDDEATA